jgi:hypothetical protein
MISIPDVDLPQQAGAHDHREGPDHVRRRLPAGVPLHDGVPGPVGRAASRARADARTPRYSSGRVFLVLIHKPRRMVERTSTWLVKGIRHPRYRGARKGPLLVAALHGCGEPQRLLKLGLTDENSSWAIA